MKLSNRKWKQFIRTDPSIVSDNPNDIGLQLEIVNQSRVDKLSDGFLFPEDAIRFIGRSLAKVGKTIPDQVMLAAMAKYGNIGVTARPTIDAYFESTDTMSEAMQIALVNQNPLVICLLINKGIIPTEAVQLAAVNAPERSMPLCLKNPSEAVQIAAVNNYSSNIRSIKNPSEAVQIAAVNNPKSLRLNDNGMRGSAIAYIEQPVWSPKIKQSVIFWLLQLIKSRRVDSAKEALNDLLKKNCPWPEIAVIKSRLSQLNESSNDINDLNNASEAEQIAAVREDIYMLLHIKNPSEAVQLAAIDRDCSAIKYIKNPSEYVQIEAIKINGWVIQYIENPTEKAQLLAVKLNPWIIQFIKNPTEKVQFEAVNANGLSIEHIKNPSEAVQLAAVANDPIAIRYLANASEKVQLQAVSIDGRTIRFIENPSKTVQLAAVKQNGMILHFIKKPDYDIQLAAVSSNGYAIELIRNPSDELKMTAVRQNGLAIESIADPSDAVQVAAVRQNGAAIKNIENPNWTNPELKKYMIAWLLGAIKRNERYAPNYLDYLLNKKGCQWPELKVIKDRLG